MNAVSCTAWYLKTQILVICFIDRSLRVYKVKGSNEEGLEIRNYEKTFKTPFITEVCQIGNHKITGEDIAVLVGENTMIQIYIDP